MLNQWNVFSVTDPVWSSYLSEPQTDEELPKVCSKQQSWGLNSDLMPVYSLPISHYLPYSSTPGIQHGFPVLALGWWCRGWGNVYVHLPPWHMLLIRNETISAHIHTHLCICIFTYVRVCIFLFPFPLSWSPHINLDVNQFFSATSRGMCKVSKESL